MADARIQIAGRRPRLLAVDDDEDLRVLISITFERLGWEVFTAGSEQDGLASVASYDPDVLMLDLGLGSGRGRDLLTTLKTDPATSWLPVIVVSGSSMPDDIAAVLREGAHDFVTKPWNVPDLSTCLDTALRITAEHRAAGH